MPDVRGISRTTALALGACCLLSVSLREFSNEYRNVVLSVGTTNDKVAAFAEPALLPPVPGSARGTRDLLATCGRVLTLAPVLKADAVLAGRVAAGCRSVAQATLQMAPSHARALAVLVLTTAPLDAGTLALAQAAAPFEPWPLNIRLKAVAAAKAPSEAVMVLARLDIGRAIMSDWGRRALVGLYQDREDFRETIALTAETAAVADQKAFVLLLRSALQSAG